MGKCQAGREKESGPPAQNSRQNQLLALPRSRHEIRKVYLIGKVFYEGISEQPFIPGKQNPLCSWVESDPK